LATELLKTLVMSQGMDRPVAESVLRKRTARRVLTVLAFIAGLICLFVWGANWLRPSISRSQIRTAVVDSGPIETTISASGLIQPEFEQVLSSPISARVVKILRRPGDHVRRGEPIVRLDTSESVLALEKLDQQISIKQNQQEKLELDLENTLITLEGQLKTKELDLKSLQLEADLRGRLRQEGLISEEELHRASVNRDKAAIELNQLKSGIEKARESTRTQLKGLKLEMNILQKEREDAQRLLARATTNADRDGVLTWVVTEEGTTVQKGDVIARIADLSTFRVEATVSDVHAARLMPGLPVRIKLNDQTLLPGQVASILPTIKDGVMTLRASLDDSANPQLRSNLRVDVYIVIGWADKALRLQRGPAINGEGLNDLFVIRGHSAVKTPVQIGMASFDNYEVKEGLSEGDEVIISDMSEYEHLQQIQLP